MRISLAALGMTLTLGSAHAAEPLTPESARAFADAIVKPALAASGVPGAWVAIVQGDRTLLAKGYGNVDGAKTQLNIASIGKPMTALATLSLARAGKLDLDRDVNEYLKAGGRDLHVTGGPATLNNLLGHRAGFDANLSHLFTDLGTDASMSDAEINRRLVLLRKPGTVNAYDNQGYGTIGLVLSAVAREPLDRVLDQLVFAPLGMTHTRSVTTAGGPDLAPCVLPIAPGNVKSCAYPVYRESLRGAGGVATTAEDIARFMRALLNEGRVDGVQAVPAELIADLTDFSRYRFHPGMPGCARTFTEFNNTDRPEYAHSGHVPGFSSMLRIFPVAEMGVAISFQGGTEQSYDAVPSVFFDYLLHYQPSPEATKAMRELEQLPDKFRDHFVPTMAAPPPPAMGVNLVTEPAGRYRPASEISKSLPGRVVRIVTQVEVTAGADGALFVSGQGSYRRIGVDLYENAEKTRIAFGVVDGKTWMATGLSAAMWERADARVPPSWTVLVAAVAVLLWPSWLFHAWSAQPRRRRTARVALAAWLVFVAAALCELQWGVWERVVQGSALVPLLWQLPLYAALATMLIAPLRAWRGSSRLARVHLAVLMALVLVLGGSWLLW